MKKVFYILILMLAISCKKDKDTAPDESFLEKQQAPFGSGGVDVKLQKLLHNSHLVAEYVYDGNYLSQEKRYVTLAMPEHFGTGSFKRNAGIPVSYEVVSADVSLGTGTVSSEFKPFYNLEFAAPANDSVRNITEEYFTYPQLYNRNYIFDKDGYIVKQLMTLKTSPNTVYNATYTRDSKHNITRSEGTIYDQNGTSGVVQFEYDSHPNPFFHLGIDWQGQMSINSFSPNNIIRETRISASGATYHIKYIYEYAPNGFPSKVTVKNDQVDATLYTLDFVY
jgi:hypothetical protein